MDKKELPILFSTQMVQAILDGRKTQTRRIIKSRHESGKFQVCKRKSDGQITEINSLGWDERNCEKDIIPKWKAGDLLWVKETFNILTYDLSKNIFRVEYETGEIRVCELTEDELTKFSKWKRKTGRHSSLFMFRSFSRIFLEVSDVRVERVQNISEEDAKSEGVEILSAKIFGANFYMNYVTDQPLICPKKSFSTLWHSIHGEGSWKSNPWVWVIKFKVLSTTGKPNN
jgi:hypothetical protein